MAVARTGAGEGEVGGLGDGSDRRLQRVLKAVRLSLGGGILAAAAASTASIIVTGKSATDGIQALSALAGIASAAVWLFHNPPPEA